MFTKQQALTSKQAYQSKIWAVIGFKPLAHESDQRVISRHHPPESHIVITRIEKIITN